MRPLLPLLLLAALVGCAPRTARPTPLAPAQTEVMATVDRLFDAMRAGDSATVRAVFHPEATLASVASRDGQTVLTHGSVDAFVRAVGAPHDAVWDERIWSPSVQIDGEMATAWMNYAFYLGDRLSHCGVNAFQLVRGAGGWQIFHIADTRRQEGCTTAAAPAPGTGGA